MCQWICFAWLVTCYSLLISITQNIANVRIRLSDDFFATADIYNLLGQKQKLADVNSRCPTKHKCRGQLFLLFLFLLEEGCHRWSWQLQCRLLHRTTGDMRCPVREVFSDVGLRTFEVGCRLFETEATWLSSHRRAHSSYTLLWLRARPLILFATKRMKWKERSFAEFWFRSLVVSGIVNVMYIS